MVFNNNVPVTLGVDAVQQQLASIFNLGYYFKMIPALEDNPFEEVDNPKFTLGVDRNYILNFSSPTDKSLRDKLDDLGFDDERFYEVLVPYGTDTTTGDQFLLFVNGQEMKMVVVDYKEDLSGLRNLSCKHLKEFLLD